MRIEGEGQRISVYVGSSDLWQGTNLAMAIVEHCRKMGIAGATVSRGIMGFGKHSRIHRAICLACRRIFPRKSKSSTARNASRHSCRCWRRWFQEA